MIIEYAGLHAHYKALDSYKTGFTYALSVHSYSCTCMRNKYAFKSESETSHVEGERSVSPLVPILNMHELAETVPEPQVLKFLD